jgi:arginyl-tRNA synthetase
LKRSAHLDVVFTWDEILSMDGNSGPYMQYAYARCASILRKIPTSLNGAVKSLDHSAEAERQLLRKLIQYPMIVQRAARDYAPHHICTYLFSLAQDFNSFYHQAPILQAETDELKQVRAQLVHAVANTIQHGLGLLGIQTVERM